MREGLRSSTPTKKGVQKKSNPRPVVKPVVRRLTRQFIAETGSVTDSGVPKLGGKVAPSLDSETKTELKIANLDGDVPPILESEVETKLPDKSVLAEDSPSGDYPQKDSEEAELGLPQHSTSSGHEEPGSVIVDHKTQEENVQKTKEDDNDKKNEQAVSVIKHEREQNIVHGDENLELNVEGSGQDKKDLPCSINVATVEVTVTEKNSNESGQDFPPCLESPDTSNINVGAATGPPPVENEEMRTQGQGDTGFEVGTSEPGLVLPMCMEFSDISNIDVGAVTGSPPVEDEEKKTQEQGDSGFEVATSDPGLGMPLCLKSSDISNTDVVAVTAPLPVEGEEMKTQEQAETGCEVGISDPGQDLPPCLESSDISNTNSGVVIGRTPVEDKERTQEQGDTDLKIGTGNLQDEPQELGNCFEKLGSGLESSQYNLGCSDNVKKDNCTYRKVRVPGKIMKSRIAALGNAMVQDSGQKIEGIVTRKRKNEHPVKNLECDEGYVNQDNMCDALVSPQSGTATSEVVELREDKNSESRRCPKKLRGRPKIVREENNGLNSVLQSGEAVNKQTKNRGNMLVQSKKKLKRGRPRLKKFDEEQKYLNSMFQNGDGFDNGVMEIERCEFNSLTEGPKNLELDCERSVKIEEVNLAPNSILQSLDGYDNGVTEIESCEFSRLTEDPVKLELECERPIKHDEVNAALNLVLQNEEGVNGKSSEIKSSGISKEFDVQNDALNSVLQNQEMVKKEAMEMASGMSDTEGRKKLKRTCVKPKNYNAGDELDTLLRKEEAAQRKAMRMMVRKKEAAQRNSMRMMVQKKGDAQRKAMEMKAMLDCITKGGKAGKRGRGRPRKVEQVTDALNVTLQNEAAQRPRQVEQDTDAIHNCITKDGEIGKRGSRRPRKVEHATDALNVSLQNEDAACVVVNMNKDQKPKKGSKIKEEVGQCDHSRAFKDNMGKSGQRQVIQKVEDMEVDVHGKVNDEVTDISRSNSTSNCKELAGRREQKQMIRDQIVEMLTSAGWRVEYRPREGRDYQDPVYVSPEGRTHWSVTKAYKKFSQKIEDGEIAPGPEHPNFFFHPIPEERLSILFRTQHVKRQWKKAPLEQKAMSNHKKTPVKSAEKSGRKSNKRKRNSLIASAQKKSLSSIRKNIQKRKKNALLVRGSGKAQDSSSDGLLSFSGKHSVLSWMIESGTVQLGERVSYCLGTKKVLEGNITRDGICCCCCEEVMSVTKFEEHADSRLCQTYENLYLENGLSLLQCQINSWNKLEDSVRSGFHLIDIDGEDPNDDTCGLCGDGGDLVCCDSCPSTFHQGCLNIEDFPSGEWQCVYCSCKYCGAVNGNVEEAGGGDPEQKYDKSANSLLTCNMCDQKYHQMCMEEKDALCIQKAFTFCGKSCEQIFERLQGLFGLKVEIGDGYTCCLIKRTDIPPDSSSSSRLAVVEQTSKLAVALGVMDECFYPIIDHRSRINLICNTVYSCGSNFKRLNFQGFFNAILEKDDELIATATVRIHGEKLAEMPFIGTRIAYRRQGMCRRLLNGIELALSSLNIEKLVIPAVAVVLETWTKVFGFKPLEKCSDEMRHMNVMQFPFTDILQKPLLNPQCTAETTAPVPGNGVQIVDSVSADQAGDGKQNTAVRVNGDYLSGATIVSRNIVDTCEPVQGDAEEGKSKLIPSAVPESSPQQTTMDVNCSLTDDVGHQLEKMEASDSDDDMGGGMMCGVSDEDSSLTRVDACKIKNDKLPGLVSSGEVVSDDRGCGSVEVENGQNQPDSFVAADKSSGFTCEEDPGGVCFHDARSTWEEGTSRK